MKINLLKLWEQAPDLNFGEALDVLEAAIQAADNAVIKARKERFRKMRLKIPPKELKEAAYKMMILGDNLDRNNQIKHP